MQKHRTSRTITRSTVAAGSLLTIKDPQFLTLVGSPANQRPFSVIRSDDSAPAAPRVIRTARRGTAQTPPATNVKRDDSGILVITFPASYDEDAAAATIDTFGLTGYTLTLNGNHYIATRSDGEVDLQSVANSKNQIRVTSDGVMLTMDDAVYTPVERAAVEGIAVVAYEFNKKTFDESAVSDWISKNSVDIAKDAAQNSDDVNISVQRRDVAEDVEVRRIEVEAGVVAVIARSDVPDVPSASIGVIEAAYGSWGWGQMDFSASMADEAFCDAFYKASDALDSVLRRIVFYSELPLDLRKTLVNNATSQFAAFVNSAIDALPRQVLLLQAVRSDADNQPKEKVTMTTADQAQKSEEAKRADAAAAAKKEDDAKPVTRGELASLVGDAVKAAMATSTTAAPETVARSDAKPADAGTKTDEPATAAATGITRADLTAAFADAIKPLSERMEKLESTSVVRSSEADAVQQQEQPNKKATSVFRGAIRLPDRDTTADQQ